MDYQEERTVRIKNKQYIRPSSNDDIFNIFEAALPESDNYDTIADAKFEIVFVAPKINKRTVAQIKKASPTIKLFNKCDYIIEISQDIFDKLDREVKKVVIEHELCHAIGRENKNGEIEYKIVKHNFEDFYSIIEKYGINWLNGLQEAAVSDEAEKRKNKNKKEDDDTARSRASDDVSSIHL